jgi:hypothetical protein
MTDASDSGRFEPELTELYNALGHTCLGYDRYLVFQALTRLLADTLMEMYDYDHRYAEQEAEDAFAAIRRVISKEAD